MQAEDTAASAAVVEVESLRVTMALPTEQEVLEEVAVLLVTGNLLVAEVVVAFSRLVLATLMPLLLRQVAAAEDRMASAEMAGPLLVKTAKTQAVVLSVAAAALNLPAVLVEAMAQATAIKVVAVAEGLIPMPLKQMTDAAAVAALATTAAAVAVQMLPEMMALAVVVALITPVVQFLLLPLLEAQAGLVEHLMALVVAL